jgi:rare lipoprotein A (peptidoglycan hydrolase)
VLLPLVSLHKKPSAEHRAVLDASGSSLALAARFGHERASRSGPRTTASAALISVEPVPETVATTTTTAAVVTAQVVHHTATTVHHSSTTRTTAKKHTTTTVKKKSTTTTTAPHASSSSAPPQLRPFTPPTPGPSTGQSEAGEATWYKPDDPATCAHKTIPMGTVLTVTNIENGKTTTCRVGDRGPYVEGRILDLSPEAFNQIASLSQGVINVKIEW